MTTKTEPRILVVAEFAPGAAGGDWVNIKQHFRGLDWGQIYWWSFCNDSSKNGHEFGGRHTSFNMPPRLNPNKSWNLLRSQIIDTFVMPYAIRHLRAFIRKVKPDLIFLMARGWMIPLGYYLMPQIKTHWHVAVYDMPDVDGMVRRLGRGRADRFTRMCAEIYKKASSRSVISPAMAEDMRLQTGVECSNFFRCSVEPEAMARLHEPAAKPPEDVIRIGYAGSILAEPTFAYFVKALQAVRRKISRKLEFHLYGGPDYTNREWYDPELIVQHGFVSEAELNRSYRAGTWGLSIMHLDDIDPRYNRYSFPCKFSMSLASGIPLICIGHPESPLIVLAKDYKLGIVLSDKNIEKLSDILHDSLEDFSRFDGYRAEVLRCAEKEFSADRNRAKLHELLDSAKYVG
jgi:glycosyltransferase involved in cell wall biosynthesis